MVTQGDIVKVSFDPQKGHEQAGYRPALVVSNDFFMQKTRLAILCPITTTDNRFPLHVRLDDRTQTSGMVLCEHVRTLDLSARSFSVIERAPDDIVRSVIGIVTAELERNPES